MAKIDIEKLKQKEIERKEKKSKGKSSDPKYLNYYDLGVNETMKIRLLPDGGDSGSYYVTFDVHGPKFDNASIETVPCANNVGERCPICAKAYEMYKDGNPESEKWRKATKHIAQCVVISAPIEIPENEDGSIIKLVNMPFKMWEATLEGIMNGTVDDPFDFENGNNFVIKLTKQGRHNRYDKSYWEAKTSEMPVEILEKLVEPENELIDLKTLIPTKGGTQDELNAWIKNVEKVLGEGGSEDNTSQTVSSRHGDERHDSSREDVRTATRNQEEDKAPWEENVKSESGSDGKNTEAKEKRVTAKELMERLANKNRK